MQKLVWINSKGTEINLTSGDYGITEWEGFSACDVEVQTQNVPFQDGSVFLDALLNNRELSVTLAINDGKDLEKRYRLRRELISALNPKLGEGYLIYTNDFISKRIKCLAQMPVFPTHNSDKAGTPKASLSWTACDPYWEDVEESSIVTTIENKEIELTNNGDIPINVKVYINSQNLDGIKIGDLVLNGLLPGFVKVTTEVGSKSAYSQKVLKELLKLNTEVISCMTIDSEYELLGCDKYIVLYNKITGSVKEYYLNFLTQFNHLYVGDIIKINDVYYAVATTSDCFTFPNLQTYNIPSGNSIIIKSNDLESWELLASIDDCVLRKIKHLNNDFYLLDAYHSVLKKTNDFESFVDINPNFDGGFAYDFYLESNLCIILGGKYLTRKYTRLKYSTDLVNFSDCNFTSLYRFLTGITKCGDKYIISTSQGDGASDIGNVILFSSANGIDWSTLNLTDNRRSHALNIKTINNDIYVQCVDIYNIYYILVLNSDFSIKNILKPLEKYFTFTDDYLYGNKIIKYSVYGYLKTFYEFFNYSITQSIFATKNNDYYLFLYNKNNNLCYQEGKINNLSQEVSLAISNKLQTIITFNNDVFIYTELVFKRWKNNEFIQSPFISPITDFSLRGIYKYNNYIYILWAKNNYDAVLEKYDNLYRRVFSTNTFRLNSTNIRLIIINESKFVVITNVGGEAGSTYEFALDSENRVTLIDIHLNPLIFDTWSRLQNKFFVCDIDYQGFKYIILEVKNIYCTLDGIHWININVNNEFVYRLFVAYNLLFIQTENNLYISYNGIDFVLFEDVANPYIITKNDDTEIDYIDKGLSEYKSYLQNDENIIKQLKNGCNLQIEVGKEKFLISKENGNGSIKISYRQKYIGV